jgi:hypothetical protein
LIISTSDNFSLPGGATAQPQDLIAYHQGSATWALYFDHSTIALNPLPEGMTAAWIDNTGNVYISGDPAGGAAVVFHEAKDSIVRRNEIYENWGEGLAAGRLSDHITLERNISWDNLHANLYLSVTTFPWVDSNLIYCTDNRAFWRKTDTRFYRAGPGLVIRDEVIDSGTSTSRGQVIINNIVVGCGRNLLISSQLDNPRLIDAVIANNTFFEARGDAGSGSVNIRFANIAADNSRFSNNLIYQSTGEVLMVDGQADLSGLIVTNNLYYPAAPDGWKPGEPGRVVGDPLLANPSNATPPDPAWYMLQPNSPAIDAGTALPQTTKDFFNKSKEGLTPDIGAHEFGNSAPASLTVVKQVSGRVPTANWQFTSSFAGAFALPAGGGQQLFENLGAGSYTVSETAVSGYAASVSCDDGTNGSNSVTVNLDNGEDVVCVFTNTALPGTVTINKTVVGQAPANPWAFSGGLGDFTLPAAGGGQTFTNVPAGVMTVTETAVAGWTTTVSCDNGASGTNSVQIDLLPGASVTCTFTNTAPVQSGSITVVKQVAGTLPASPWTFSGTLGNFTLPAAGGSQAFSNQPAGSYTITEGAVSGYSPAVNCNNGASGGASVTFSLSVGQNVTCTFINTQSSSSAVTFSASEDSYVDSGVPQKNFGNTKTLKVRNAGNDQIAYLKFNVTGLAGSVQSATLRLFVTDGGPDGGSVHLVANNWTEAGIKWSNRPVVPGSQLDSAGAAVQGQWVELDVTAAVSGNGTFSFAVQNNSTNTVIYGSSEQALAKRPQLVIVRN